MNESNGTTEVLINEENKRELVDELFTRANILHELLPDGKTVHIYLVMSTFHLFGKPMSEADSMMMSMLNIAINNAIDRKNAKFVEVEEENTNAHGDSLYKFTDPNDPLA